MNRELKDYLLAVACVFIMFAGLMGLVFIVTYVPQLREGFTMFCGKQVAKWEDIKEIWCYMWIVALIVCPFMALFIYPLFDEGENNGKTQ